MASTPAGRQLTEQHRLRQLGVRAAAAKDILRLMAAYDLSDIDRSWLAIAPGMEAVVREYHRQSAGVAADYYQAYRTAEAVSGSPALRLADPPDPEALAYSLGFYGRVAPKQMIQKGTRDVAAKTTTLMVGGATRHVLDGGRGTLISSAKADERTVGWARVTAAKPCSFCAMLAGRGAVYKEATVGFQAHDTCVPAGTLVTGPSVEVGYRRWYEGEMLIVRLASGDELSITPNHPVLTDRGWVDAGLLREDDEVVQRTGADLASLKVPHEDDAPTPIEDVWGAPRMDWLRSVPVASEDFHGDGGGSKGDVDVVAPYGLLTDVGHAPGCEPIGQPVGAGAGASSVLHSLSTERDLALMLLSVGDAALGLVGGNGLECSLVGSEGRRMQSRGVFDASTLDPDEVEPAFDHVAGDAMALRQGILRDTRPVVFGQAIGDRGPAQPQPLRDRPRYDPASAQVATDGIGVEADLGRRLRERLAGGVELCRVVELRRRGTWAGHVYNLQTAEGWYSANGVIVANCACTAEPVYRRDAPLPGRAEEFRSLYDKHASGASDPVNAFRRAYEHPSLHAA